MKLSFYKDDDTMGFYTILNGIDESCVRHNCVKFDILAMAMATKEETSCVPDLGRPNLSAKPCVASV